MYYVAHTGEHSLPLDFNTPRHTDTVADAPGSEPCPRDLQSAPDLDTGALLAELGLSAQAVLEALTSSSDPIR